MLEAFDKSKNKKQINIKEKSKEFLYFPGTIEFKEEGEEFYSYGFVATTHPDRSETEEYKGDILTPTAIKSVVNQINQRRGLMADLASYRHDWVKEENPNLPPVGRAIEAEVRELPGGHYGAWVKTHHSKSYPAREDVINEVKDGYLPGYSIEYVAGDTRSTVLPTGNFRVIDSLDLKGYGFANGRMIANPKAIIEGFSAKEIKYKELDNFQIKSKEEIKMSEDEKVVEAQPVEPKEEPKVEVPAKEEDSKVEVDNKEYSRFKNFLDMERKEKAKEETKVMLKELIKEIMPENKIQMKEVETKEALIEFKEWKEISTDNISAKEAFSRAKNLAVKTGAIDRWWNGETSNSGQAVEFKCGGVYGEKIEIKALTSTTNKSSDTDYLQTAAELSDIYAPAITKMLNQKTTYFGLLPKEDWSGRALIQWRAENVANASSAAYLEGDAITKGNTTRQKLLEHFKYYKVGFQVTGQMMAQGSSGIGDIFQAEIESATRAMLSTMNQGLFAEVGTFAAAGFLGLEYCADSTGNTTLYGLTRSTTNLLGAAGSEYAAQSSAPISKATLRTGIRTLEINGADRNDLIIVCDPVQRDLVLSLLDDAQRFNGTSARAGFEGMPTFDGIPMHADKDCQDDDIYIVNMGMNGAAMAVNKPVTFEDLAKSDDSRSGFLKFYGNQYFKAPKQALYMIQGLATS